MSEALEKDKPSKENSISVIELIALVISVLALVFSGLSYIESRNAVSEAREANDLAIQSNSVAEEANRYSSEANRLSTEANLISNRVATATIKSFELEGLKIGSNFKPVWKTHFEKGKLIFHGVEGNFDIQRLVVQPPYSTFGFRSTNELPFKANLDSLDFYTKLKDDLSNLLKELPNVSYFEVDCPVLITTRLVVLGDKTEDKSIYNLRVKAVTDRNNEITDIEFVNFEFFERASPSLEYEAITKKWRTAVTTFPNNSLNLSTVTDK